MRHRLPQVPAVHLQLLLLGEARHCPRPFGRLWHLGASLCPCLVGGAGWGWSSKEVLVLGSRGDRPVCPQLAGLAVMAVGIWTLALKSDYISLLASNTYLATAYILVVAGVVVMVTGLLGCCATFKERRNLLRPVRRTPLALGAGVPGWGLPPAVWGRRD